MATITARKRAGGVRYTAQVRIKRKGQVVYSESKTFAKRALAKEWAARREHELQADPSALSRLQHRGVTIGDLVQRYLDDRDAIEPLGRSKRLHLLQLLGMDLANLDAIELEPKQLVAHVRRRRLAGVSGATANNDLIWLRVVMRYARSALGIPVSRHAVDDAAEICWSERLIARPRRRERRPSSEELQALAAYFGRDSSRKSTIKDSMYLLMWFAIYSSRRLGEICRMRLSDLDSEHGVWLVRDVKNPGGSSGNDLEMVVPEALLPVIDVMTEVVSDGDRVAPFVEKTIGSYWTRAMKLAGVDDLHFHDLRHEACSRLAEDGAGIPQIQQVSLHESWSSLQRYVNLHKRKPAGARVEFDPGHASIERLRKAKASR